jgi:hypothetical protein
LTDRGRALGLARGRPRPLDDNVVLGKLMSTWFRRGRGAGLGILVGALTVGSAGPRLVNGLGGLSPRSG